MPRYFQPGHVLGKPSPLFTRIEQSRLDELKAKYGGQQQQQQQPGNTTATPLPATAAEATKAVSDQGEKVRQLKASGAEKAVWQPEVELLLKLKKHLATLSTSGPTAAAAPQPALSVEEATKAVAEQGEKVRLLKASGVEKSVWQPEVDVLLKLKKQLSGLSPPAAAKPTAQVKPVAPTANGGDAASIERAVAEQAEKVRQLKTGGAAKTVWQPEVDRLLALKKQLTELTGVEAAPAPSKNGSKKK